MSRSRQLALLLVALATLATFAAGMVPAVLLRPARIGLLLGLPLVAGAVASVLLPRSAKRLGRSARVRGTARFHLVLAGALALDLGAVGIAYALDWATLTYGDQALQAWKLVAVPIALPFTIAAATLGAEWALHARLWEVVSRENGARRATVLAIACGVALAVPALAPGFRVEKDAFLVAGLAIALLRETTTLALFRRGGLFVAGAYRGTLMAIDGVGLGDWFAFYFPVANYVSSAPGFYVLRVAGPLAALLLVLASSRPERDATA